MQTDWYFVASPDGQAFSGVTIVAGRPLLQWVQRASDAPITIALFPSSDLPDVFWTWPEKVHMVHLSEF